MRSANENGGKISGSKESRQKIRIQDVTDDQDGEYEVAIEGGSRRGRVFRGRSKSPSICVSESEHSVGEGEGTTQSGLGVSGTTAKDEELVGLARRSGTVSGTCIESNTDRTLLSPELSTVSKSSLTAISASTIEITATPIPASITTGISRSASGSAILSTSTSANSSQTPTVAGSRQGKSRYKSWMWEYFKVEEINRPWTLRRSNTHQTVDREIRCTVRDEFSGEMCDWRTWDSKRQSSTSNMTEHLRKRHAIENFEVTGSSKRSRTGGNSPNQELSPTKVTGIISHSGSNSGNMATQIKMESNLYSWMICTKQSLSSIQTPAFQRIFHDLPGVLVNEESLTINYCQRLEDDFGLLRSKQRNELGEACATISLSFQVWESQLHAPILCIFGHWVTYEFEYHHSILDLQELEGGIASDQNILAVLLTTIEELNLEKKLFTITCNDEAYRKVLFDELFRSLTGRMANMDIMFEGNESWIKCFDQVIDQIVRSILYTLGSRNGEESCQILNDIIYGDGFDTANLSCIERLRLFFLWVLHNSSHRDAWRQVCRIEHSNDPISTPSTKHRLGFNIDWDQKWNSTANMIQAGLDRRHEINLLLTRQPTLCPIHQFSQDDWNHLHHIGQVLTSFKRLADQIHRENFEASKIVVVIYQVYDLLRAGSLGIEGFNQFNPSLRQSLNTGFQIFHDYMKNCKWQNSEYLSFVLDPRFKDKSLRFDLDFDLNSCLSSNQPSSSSNLCDSSFSTVKLIREKLLQQLYQLHRIQANSKSTLNTPPNSHLLPHSYRHRKKCRPRTDQMSHLADDFLQLRLRLSRDIDTYFQREPVTSLPALGGDQWELARQAHSRCTLDCWKCLCHTHRDLSLLAQAYLSIPASTTCISRFREQHSDILSDNRRSTSPWPSLRMLLLLHASRLMSTA